MVLTIKEITIRNFRSYGDYDTVLKLDGLGPVLVVGERDDSVVDSNGAGKTTLVDAILWCLFGRVPTRTKPGDTIVNWFAGKDCIVKILTCDNYTITRTRGVDGHDDLLIHTPEGRDVSLSTNPNTQQYLNKLFNLDYEIFMSSVFFAQFGQAFLELPDPRRKKALERMLHLIKYDIIAEVAKEKIAEAELQQAQFVAQREQFNRDILRVTQSIDLNLNDSKQFETDREARLSESRTSLANVDEQFMGRAAELQVILNNARTELEQITTHDVDKLEREWSEYQAKVVKLDGENKRIALISEEIAKNTSERNTLLARKNTFDPTQELTRLNKELIEAENELSQIVVPNRASVVTAWEKLKAIRSAQSELEVKKKALTAKFDHLSAEQSVIQAAKDKWDESAGQICSECQQPITSEHILSQTEPFAKKLSDNSQSMSEIATEISELGAIARKLDDKLTKSTPTQTIAEIDLMQKNYDSASGQVDSIRESIKQINVQQEKAEAEEKTRHDRISRLAFEIKTRNDDLQRKTKAAEATKASLDGAKPEVTLSEAQAVKRLFDSKNQEIAAIQSSITALSAQKKQMKDDIKADIEKITKETNPYKKITDQLKTELGEMKTELTKAEKRVNQFDTIIKHLDYVRSSYSDRRKIKAHTLGKLVPYLNQRIAYYLDALECKCQLEFNAFLQMKNSMWPYDQYSGGERKRIDLAVMFAIYDLHNSLYEQRCNLLVLDEIDGKLDSAGINHFVNLLYKEFIDNQSGTKPRAILVISHKSEMRDAFPAKILIKKDGDFSRLADIS